MEPEQKFWCTLWCTLIITTGFVVCASVVCYTERHRIAVENGLVEDTRPGAQGSFWVKP